MNYYKRHLGDYAKDTGHLTALEHGVYTLLLDWYYANERPIPDSLTVRIARGNPEETQTVLSEFFNKTDEGWVHHYADRVIAEYNAKAERNRASGLLGGRPKKTQTVSEANPKETLATSHKPLASKEDQEHAPADADAPPADPKPKRPKRAEVTLTAFSEQCREAGEEVIPGDDPVFTYAQTVGLPTEYVALAWAWFKGRYGPGGDSAGKRYADWRAAFRNAVKGNWPKYWAVAPTGEVYLTATGKLAQREAQA